jgi:membrane protein implicated in regulation of membrane protease activity
MAAWLIWLIVAGVLAVAEMSSLTLILLMLAGGAGAGSITAAAGAPVAVQIVVAAAATLALLGVVRPVAKRHLLPSGPSRSGTAALVGMQAVVLSEVDHEDGRVRLNGAEWSARAYDPDERLTTGTVVRVVEITGATAVVIHEPDPSDQE